MTDETTTIDELREGTVEELKNRLEAQDLATLLAMRKAEADEGDGKARSTALAAIDAAVKAAKARAVEEALAEHAVPRADYDAVVAERDRLREENAAHVENARTGAEELQRNNAEVAQLRAQATSGGATAQTLDDMPLGALEQLRSVAIAEASGNPAAPSVTRLDAAIEALQRRAKDAPRADVNDTKTVVLPTRAARDAIEAGAVRIALSDGGQPIDGLETVVEEGASGPRAWRSDGGRMVFERPIRLSRDLPQSTVTHAHLIAADGQLAGICEIPGGVRAGAGLEAELPAGSLAF